MTWVVAGLITLLTASARRATIGPIQEIKTKDLGTEGAEGGGGKEGGDSLAQAAATAREVPWLERYVDMLVPMLLRLWEKLTHRFRRDRLPKHLVPILITPVKRLEREAQKSSKRVHFKLRKRVEREVFQPLERNSKTVQNWLMFMTVSRRVVTCAAVVEERYGCVAEGRC
jgi:hypothetical protein